jgi:hypothetical protein
MNHATRTVTSESWTITSRCAPPFRVAVAVTAPTWSTQPRGAVVRDHCSGFTDGNTYPRRSLVVHAVPYGARAIVVGMIRQEQPRPVETLGELVNSSPLKLDCSAVERYGRDGGAPSSRLLAGRNEWLGNSDPGRERSAAKLTSVDHCSPSNARTAGVTSSRPLRIRRATAATARLA